jgi:hypothetical protein
VLLLLFERDHLLFRVPMDISELDAMSEFIDIVDIDSIDSSDLDEDGDMVMPDSFGGMIRSHEDGVQILCDQCADDPPNQDEQVDDARARAREYEKRYRRKKKVPKCIMLLQEASIWVVIAKY